MLGRMANDVGLIQIPTRHRLLGEIVIFILIPLLVSGCFDRDLDWDWGVNLNPDKTPPAAITDLQVVSTSSHMVRLAWTATGDNGLSGYAAHVYWAVSPARITESSLGITWRMLLDSPPLAGTPDTFTVSGLHSGQGCYFAVIAYDYPGNRSSLSNVVKARTSTTPATWWQLPRRIKLARQAL